MNDLHERSASVADPPATALSSGRAAPATSGAPAPVSTRDSGTPDLKVSIARPPQGKDFNDVLRDHMSNSDGDKVTSHHPISEIIRNAEEIRDPIDELTEEVKNGTLTRENLFSQKKIDRLARKREESYGPAFYEGFRISIKKAHIFRMTELDKAVDKRNKEIKAKQETPAIFGNHKFEDRANMLVLGNNGEAGIRIDREALGDR